MIAKFSILSKTILKKTLYFTALFVVLLSLFGYNPEDLSLNKATEINIHNPLGRFGSNIAGFIFEIFGLSIFSHIFYSFIISKIVKNNKYLKILSYFIFNMSILLILIIIPINKSWQFENYASTIGLITKFYFPFSKILFLSIGIILFLLNALLIWYVNFYKHNDISFTSMKKIPCIKNIVKSIPNNNQFKQHIDLKPQIDLPQLENKKIKPFDKFKEKNMKIIIDGEFVLPSLEFLMQKKENIKQGVNYTQQAKVLESVLNDFKIDGSITQISVGPVVALYELEPSAGTKSSTVITLANDIARTMSALSARIAIVPGRNAIGIELPNQKRETVFLREILESEQYKNLSIKLPIALGKSINGTSVVVDLTKMPHLLIAGTTGSGKSVAINAMILSLIYRLTPDTCKLIMIDPKMLELSIYDKIPHLIAPVVIDPKKAIVALKWVIKEMEKRYKLMSQLSVRNIDGYNNKIEETIRNNSKIFININASNDEEKIQLKLEKMPFIVVIVDEMADLMLVAGKEIETSIQRLAQMARAAGIHIIMATQRPSVDVITGVIKANFPTRISFSVTSRIDSRTILNEQGAEQLLGMGDMLYMSGGSNIQRIHGPFVSDEEVQKVVEYLKEQGKPEYIEDITNILDNEEEISTDFSNSDNIYDKAIKIILRDQKVSISYLQRQLQIGYNKAANIVERMEKEGIITPPNNVGKRTILLKS